MVQMNNLWGEGPPRREKQTGRGERDRPKGAGVKDESESESDKIICRDEGQVGCFHVVDDPAHNFPFFSLRLSITT